MENSAPRKTQVLITDVASFLGKELAKSLLSNKCKVYGISKKDPPLELIEKKDFTLLELDLAQPLPPHLPKFDLVFYISHETSPFTPGLSQIPHFSAALNNILTLSNLSHIKILITLPISTDPQVYDYLAKSDEEKEKLMLFFVGDLYGPGMDLKSANHLANLIFQATSSDKVILENEGSDIIYPAFISDIIFAINKFVFEKDPIHPRKTHILVSQNPLNTLSAAYKIQNAARLSLANEPNLFFRQADHRLPPEQIVKIDTLDFSPKVELDQGLKETFEYFAKIPNKPAPLPIQYVGASRPLPSKNRRAQILTEVKMPKLSGASLAISQKAIDLAKSPGHKKWGLFVTILVLLFLGKIALDIYLGVSYLEKAKVAALEGDFKKAREKANVATNSFKNSASKINLLSKPVARVIPSQNINYIFDGLISTSQSVASLASGAENLTRSLAIISQKDLKADGLDLESPRADFKRAYFESAQSLELSRKAKVANILKGQIDSIEKASININSLSVSAFEIASTIEDLIGKSGPKSYLLILQNNAELRPGGGFIGNIGLIDFENGRLKDITVEDVYTLDGQLKEKISPPPQIKEKLGTEQFYLRDSNWSPDFALNAQIARDFFKKETGKNVDGVISLDLTFLQRVLEKTGPIKLADYNEEITSQNLFEKGEYYSEVGFFPGSTQKRDFFGALSRALISKVLSSLNSKEKSAGNVGLLSLIEVFKEGLREKHVMLTFDNSNLAAYIMTHDWNRPLPPATFNPGDDTAKTRDFLAISEANLGANKVNRFIDRKIEYEMTIGRDADLVAKLKISYTNNSQAETWPGGKYVNFLRVYVPPLATILSFNGSEQIDPKTLEIRTQGNLSAFATFVEVPPKSTKEVSFSYRLPKSIKLETAPTYHLYIQKQPGTEKDPLEFKFNLPGYLIVKSVNGDESYAASQNLSLSQDLSIDRQFQIEVAKK